jgi:cytochrome c556
MYAMPRLHLALAAACLVAAAGVAGARPGLSAEQFIAARQASLDMSAVTIGGIKSAIKGGQEAKTQAYPATALAKWARVLPTLFPAGTGQGQTRAPTHALARIWTDRAGFDKAAADYAAATGRLVDLAKANDTAGFQAGLAEVSQACIACHRAYKEAPRPE